MADTGTTGRIGGILKTTFGPKVEEQQNLMAVSRKRYGKADSYFRAPGSSFAFPARVAGARGAIAPAASDDPLPTSVEQKEVQFNVFDRGYSGQISFYDKDIANARKDFQSFIPLMEDRTTQCIKDFEKIINIDFVAGDGSGILGVVAAGTTASATLTLNVGTGFGQWGSRYLMSSGGDVIDFYDSTLTTSRTGGVGVSVSTVTPSVAGAAATIVVSAPLTLTTGDVMVRGAGRVNKSYIGLAALTSNAATTFQGLSRSTYPILAGNAIPCGGQTLTESLLQQLLTSVEIGCGEMPDEMLVGNAQWDQYFALGYAQKRFMDSKLDKGFQTSEFDGIPFIKDVDVPPSVVYALTKDTIKFGQVTPLSFMDTEGDVLKWFPGYARYMAVPREWGNFCYTRPNANGRLDTLAYPLVSTYAR